MRRIIRRMNDGLNQASLPDESATPGPGIPHEGNQREYARQNDAANNRGEHGLCFLSFDAHLGVVSK